MQPERADLYFQQGSSDKVYRLQLENVQDQWSVQAQWGRRGSALQSDVKVSGTSYEEAKRVYDRILREKTGKGYQIAQATANGNEAIAVGLPATKEHSGHTPELLTPIEEPEALLLAQDASWWFQQKFDGRRLAVQKSEGRYSGINKLGQIIPIDSRLAESLDRVQTQGFLGWNQLDSRTCKVELQEAEQAHQPCEQKRFERQRSRRVLVAPVLGTIIVDGFGGNCDLRASEGIWPTRDPGRQTSRQSPRDQVLSKARSFLGSESNVIHVSSIREPNWKLETSTRPISLFLRHLACSLARIRFIERGEVFHLRFRNMLVSRERMTKSFQSACHSHVRVPLSNPVPVRLFQSPRT